MPTKNIIIKEDPIRYVNHAFVMLPALMATGKIKVEDILNHVDILAALGYYGATELLDMIGEEEIRAYLALQKQ